MVHPSLQSFDYSTLPQEQHLYINGQISKSQNKLQITNLIKRCTKLLFVTMLAVVSVTSAVNVFAQPERGLVLQEPADVAPPANATATNATSLENVNATSPISVVNRSTESTSEGPSAIVEPEPAQQEQNVTEPEPGTDNQSESQKSSEIPQNITDSEEPK